MKKLVLISLLVSSASWANEAPPVPEGGLSLILTSSCTDMESGQKGQCYYMQDMSSVQYLTFYQGEVLMLIRQINPDGGYTTIWVNDEFNSI